MDYSSFPYTHPNLFTEILLCTDVRTILNSRAVCQSWRNWFLKNSIWKKFLALIHSKVLQTDWSSDQDEDQYKKLTHYRIKRLLHGAFFKNADLSELDCLSLSVKIEKCFRQLQQNFIPKASADTYRYITKLPTELNEEKDIKSIGPISLFIRIKVDHPLVVRIVTEILNKYLTSIIVDKAEKDNQKLQIFVMRAMATGQNWVFRYFHADQDPEFANAEIYASEEEAIKASRKSEITEDKPNHPASANNTKHSELATEHSEDRKEAIPEQGVKRKIPDEEEESAKRQRVEDAEDHVEEHESIYSTWKTTNPNFPTILELLDIDHPVVEEALVSRFHIDKILVVPRLEEFILHQEKYTDLVQGGLEIIGRDQDGNVSKIDPEKDFFVTDSAVVGYIDNIITFEVAKNQLIFWGVDDVRNRWKEFSNQLEQAEDCTQEKKNVKKGLPMFCSNPTTSDSSLNSVESIAAVLVSRGITITKR